MSTTIPGPQPKEEVVVGITVKKKVFCVVVEKNLSLAYAKVAM